MWKGLFGNFVGIQQESNRNPTGLPESGRNRWGSDKYWRAPPWDTLRLFVAFLHLFGFHLCHSRERSFILHWLRGVNCTSSLATSSLTKITKKKSFHFYVITVAGFAPKGVLQWLWNNFISFMVTTSFSCSNAISFFHNVYFICTNFYFILSQHLFPSLKCYFCDICPVSVPVSRVISILWWYGSFFDHVTITYIMSRFNSW